tara:strand:+ start:1442 stop:1627 length:186 start_codon:yes stop_codon:yes gene_type:complete
MAAADSTVGRSYVVTFVTVFLYHTQNVRHLFSTTNTIEKKKKKKKKKKKTKTTTDLLRGLR